MSASKTTALGDCSEDHPFSLNPCDHPSRNTPIAVLVVKGTTRACSWVCSTANGVVCSHYHLHTIVAINSFPPPFSTHHFRRRFDPIIHFQHSRIPHDPEGSGSPQQIIHSPKTSRPPVIPPQCLYSAPCAAPDPPSERVRCDRSPFGIRLEDPQLGPEETISGSSCPDGRPVRLGGFPRAAAGGTLDGDGEMGRDTRP